MPRVMITTDDLVVIDDHYPLALVAHAEAVRRYPPCLC
jgi:hypothetical protein